MPRHPRAATRLASALLGAAFLLGLPLPAAADPLRDPNVLGLDKAEKELAQSGFVVKGAFLPGGPTIFTGGRGVTFLTEHLFIGGAGYGGLMLAGGTVAGGLGYGGCTAGWQTRLGGIGDAGVACLLGGGGGGGNLPTGPMAGGSIVLEPQAFAALSLGHGMRLGVTGGYLWMPMLPGASGATTGLRFEFKNFLMTWPIDD